MQRIIKFIITLAMALSLAILPAFADSSADIWPIFYTTDNGGPDNGYAAFYDQNASAWQQRLIDNDLTDSQWSPQRNAIGWDTAGKWNVTFVGDAGTDLQLWESPDDAWLDDAGAWAMTDNDVSLIFLNVDSEVRQNMIFSVVYDNTILAFFIDLAAGVPAWTALNADSVASGVNQFSVVLDRNLMGTMHIAYADGAGNVDYAGAFYSSTWADKSNAIVSAAYPQVIVDNEQRVWIFATFFNNFLGSHSFDSPADATWLIDVPIIYAANALSAAHHSTWRVIDDTAHCVLVDFDDLAPNSTFLIYLRRTPNGWTAPTTLLTVDSDGGGDNDSIVYPQICNATDGSLFVSYILEGDVGLGGDLQGFYLDAEDYDNYTTVGAGGWILHTNIDGSGDAILEAVMPDYIPISGKI